MDELKQIVSNLYDKKGYLDMYGGSIFITFISIFVFFILMSYFHVRRNIEPIRKNWAKERCSPSVIPFAGIINKDPNMSAFDFTSKNFNGCVNNILASIAHTFLQPIYYSMNLIHKTLEAIGKSIQMIRSKISNLSSNFASLDSKFMGIVFNSLLPIQNIFIKLKDTLAKTNGVLTATIFTVLGNYLSLRSFAGAFLELMIKGLIALVAIIVPLLFFVFTIPVAVPLLAIFGTVAGLMATVIVYLRGIVRATQSIPRRPRRCFDKDTEIKLLNGEVKKISMINVGDVLLSGNGGNGGNEVTSIFKLSRDETVPMYRYKGVVVSGSHHIKVMERNEGLQEQCGRGSGCGCGSGSGSGCGCSCRYILKRIDELKDINDTNDIEILDNYNEPYLYCLNTTSKDIEINGVLFCDWDELGENDMKKLSKRYNNTNNTNQTPQYNQMETKCGLSNNRTIDNFGGFYGDLLLSLKNGSICKIKDICVNDILMNGEKVLGIVKTKAKQGNNNNRSSCIYKYEINDIEFIGGNNICLYKNYDNYNNLIFQKENIPLEMYPDYLYHLITDTGYIKIKNTFFSDYDGLIDRIIQSENI